MQVLGASTCVLAVTALLWGISVRGDMHALEAELETTRAQLDERAPAPPPAAPKTNASDAMELDRLGALLKDRTREAKRLRETIAGLDGKIRALEEKARNHRCSNGSAGAARTAGAPTPLKFKEPPLPPPPGESGGDGWRHSVQGELQELTQALSLTREQAAQVRTIVADSQNEFERRLMEAGQQGVRDVSIIETIGDEVSKKTERRIRQILYPEQQQAFDAYLPKMEGR
jgi:Spy/CpxP family protein refolding chaperone